MSAEETRALVARYYDAFNEGAIAGMLDCLADGVVHDVNQGGRRIGREAFENFCLHMARCYDERLTDIVILVSDDGTRAAAEFVVHGTYVETEDGLPEARGQPYVLPGGTFFEVAAGRIARVTTYYNLEAWIRQVEG